jgi:hypothetical protein
MHPPDPVTVLKEHAASLAHLDRHPAPELGTGVERWALVDTNGDTTSALWRAAPSPERRAWTVVLLGGLRTGENAALLLPEDLRVHVLALDWPWDGPHRMGSVEFIRRLPAVQRAVLRSPATLALGVEAAASISSTDPHRIAIVGTSLGVPPAVACVRLTKLPRAAVLLHGAANLDSILERALEPHISTGVLRRAVTHFIVRLIRPLEPSLHATAWQGRPVLIVNAERDERLPRGAIADLHAAFPWAERRWLPGGHVRSKRDPELLQLARDTADWLASVSPIDGTWQMIGRGGRGAARPH